VGARDRPVGAVLRRAVHGGGRARALLQRSAEHGHAGVSGGVAAGNLRRAAGRRAVGPDRARAGGRPGAVRPGHGPGPHLRRGRAVILWWASLGTSLLSLPAPTSGLTRGLGVRGPTARPAVVRALLGRSAWLWLSVLVDVLIERVPRILRVGEDMKNTLMW